MLSSWLDSDDIIIERLDASFYSPEHVESEHRITKRGRIRLSALAEKIIDHSFLDVRTGDYVDDGVPFVRVRDLGDILLKTADLTFITREAHVAESNTIFLPGDILVAKTGKVAASLVPPSMSECNTSQDVMGIVVDDKVDSHYIATFLGSETGLLQQQRWQSGQVQPHLTLGNLRQLFVFLPNPTIQRAIGDKIRKAERLLEFVAATSATFDAWLKRATDQSELPPEQQCLLSHVPAQTCPDSVWVASIDPADRVDPWPNHLAPRTVRAGLRKCPGTRRFSDFFAVVSDSRDRFIPPDADGCYFISVLDVFNDGYVDWRNARATRYSSPGTRIECRDLLYSTLNPQESRFCVIPGDRVGKIAASTEFTVLRLADEAPVLPYLLAAAMRSSWVRVQSSFLTRSSSLSRRRLHDSDLTRLLIPWRDEDAHRLNDELGLALAYRYEAEDLIQSAKDNLEGLLNGTASESQIEADGAALSTWLENN